MCSQDRTRLRNLHMDKGARRQKAPAATPKEHRVDVALHCAHQYPSWNYVRVPGIAGPSDPPNSLPEPARPAKVPRCQLAGSSLEPCSVLKRKSSMTKVWRLHRFFLSSHAVGVTLKQEPEPGGLAPRESFLFSAPGSLPTGWPVKWSETRHNCF